LGRLAVCDFTNYRVLEKMQLYERRLENSLHKTRAELEKLQAARRARHKARQQSAPADNQANLKKQSQSVPCTMGARAVMAKDCGDAAGPAAAESKADQSQLKAQAPAGRSRKRQDSPGASAR
ncbi:MAG: hypothetical protein ACYS7Y_13760, partial [Planctomycetota bacterium]